ncbi:GGDEF domain-containing protein [Deinococcus ruber]|uniref:GGDEF domain-containing protein n=1 Tax=Deinococcus ruber TaxID=1848197 RepID=A0A918BXU5_9DEIO|nr:GGDEF domain-containing protein [Deinococcus ruber]GGQ96206.1 hypothetical protein GCM10008957_05530 [Deinococcus ruber]
MSATSSRPSLPARQVASSLEQGRRVALQVVCAGYWLYLLLHMLLLPTLRFDPLGPELMTGYLGLIVLVLTSLPQINLHFLILSLTAMCVPFVLFEMSAALLASMPPSGYMGWVPVIVILVFIVLPWRLGSIISGLLILNILRGLYFAPHHSPDTLNAWLSTICVMLTLTVIGAMLSRFVEDRLVNHQEVHQQLAEARMDALTKVLGRAAAEEVLEHGMQRSRDNQQPLSLLLCDLDNFKAINDRHGHPAGDAVLRAAARRLRRHIGRMGTVARWGGEEFVVILPGITKTDALMLAEQLRRDIASSELAGIPVTASFGVSAYRVGDSLSDLFERSDQRLYEAKNAGRNMVRG